MTTIGDTHEFEFPADITRRERLEFSKHAGVQLAALGKIFSSENPDLAAFTVEIETAMILLAARRVDPTITFDQVLDHDGWTLAPSVEEVDASPLAETTNSEPSGSTSSQT